VATLATVGSGRGWLGAVVARQSVGRNGRCTSTGGFLVMIESHKVVGELVSDGSGRLIWSP